MRHPLTLCAAAALASCASQPTPHADHEHHHHHGHHHAGPVGHRFEDADQWAQVFDDPARDAWQMPAHVVERMAITPGMTVVDLGAGTGYFESHLARAVGDTGRVLALDVEDSMVQHITARAAREGWRGVTARRIGFDDPGLDAASVDRVLVVDTWHHIAEREAYARRLATALRPGGAVYVVDFTQETDKGPPPEHRVTAQQVVSELTAGGLAAEVVADERLPDQYIVRATRR